MKKFLAFLPFFYTFSISAQVSDTTKVTALPMVTIAGSAAPSSIGRLEPIAGTYIFDGKKNEVISLTQSDVNIKILWQGMEIIVTGTWIVVAVIPFFVGLIL